MATYSPAVNGNADEERARLQGEIARAEKMLANERFVQNAKPEVVQAEYEEMGRITGAGVSALKMRVKRACEFLRMRLAEVERA